MSADVAERLRQVAKSLRGVGRRFARADHILHELQQSRHEVIEGNWEEPTEVTRPVQKMVKETNGHG